MTELLHKGAPVPADVPEDQIRHLLSVKLIAPVEPADPPPPADADTADGKVVVGAAGSDPATDPAPDTGSTDPDPGGDTGESVTDVAEARAEARAKLDAAGGKPTGRHGQPVWAEYLVTLGYDWHAVAKASKEELQQLAAQVQQQ